MTVAEKIKKIVDSDKFRERFSNIINGDYNLDELEQHIIHAVDTHVYATTLYTNQKELKTKYDEAIESFTQYLIEFVDSISPELCNTPITSDIKDLAKYRFEFVYRKQNLGGESHLDEDTLNYRYNIVITKDGEILPYYDKLNDGDKVYSYREYLQPLIRQIYKLSLKA